MQYRVEELATAAGVGVDTIRFYRQRGLIGPPRREGRVAWYDGAHLARLRRIRTLGDEGFTLRQIGRLLEGEAGGGDGESSKRGRSAGEAEDLLDALVEERVGGRTYSRQEVADSAGVPESLVVAAETAGLVVPIELDGEPRYGAADVEMGRAALALLGAGFPVEDLMALAVQHARNVTELADASIDLFGQHVRRAEAANEAPGESRAATEDDLEPTAAIFRDLLPEVTRLVALHFQRTLVRRALERLGESGDRRVLQDALERAATAELEIAWR